ncbi:MAG TPA: LysE family translocator [Solirubrobacteraceae bacterium]|nr:LysE family translocator [Solirubrobacteraceae bacterium]
MIVNLGAFIAVSALLILAPGLDTALITRNAVLHGRRAAVATALGVNTGMAVWTVASAAGLVALVEASAVAFTVLKLAGAAYLVWIGVATLFASWRPGGARPQRQPPRRELAPRTGYRQGLVCNVANPKAAVIFTSLLPQFVSGHHPSGVLFLELGGIFVLLALVLQGTYAVLAARASRVLLRGRLRTGLDRLTGIVLIGLGVRLATERR